MWNGANVPNVRMGKMLRLPGKGQRLKFLMSFVWIEAQACTFPFALIGLLALTRVVEIPWFPRNDWLFILCVLIQVAMVVTKLESIRDAMVVALFHLLGMGLELYKVQQGSWSYPGEAHLHIGPVPLYAGFMYGSVASFMCLAWKKHDLRASDWPTLGTTIPFALVVYAQFFVPVWPMAARLVMVAVTVWLFRKSLVHFSAAGQRWHIPMPLAFALIGTMIYIAENIGTALGAWLYPHQLNGWQPVHPTKLLSWILLMTVSLVIVAEYKRRLAVQTTQELQPSQAP